MRDLSTTTDPRSGAANVSFERPVVSVVMPTFNRQDLLPASVASVRNQSFQDWELLVVDDHSTDCSRELVESWQAEDPRIRYLVNEHTKGPAGARNTGIDSARRQIHRVPRQRR